MDRTSSEGVTTAFLERFGSGEFDEAEDLIHPKGPLEGAGDVAMLVSLLATDFLAALVLGAIPTEVTGTTVIEEGRPEHASRRASTSPAWSRSNRSSSCAPGATNGIPVTGDATGGASGASTSVRRGGTNGPTTARVGDVPIDRGDVPRLGAH